MADDNYTMEKGDVFEEPAHPGTPLEPDELPESPPEFQTTTQEARKEPAVAQEHPTKALSTLPLGKKVGKPASGKHPTAELHIKPRGRR